MFAALTSQFTGIQGFVKEPSPLIEAHEDIPTVVSTIAASNRISIIFPYTNLELYKPVVCAAKSILIF